MKEYTFAGVMLIFKTICKHVLFLLAFTFLMSFLSECALAATAPLAVKNLQSWYDLSDSSTMTLGNEEVFNIVDKSGNGNTLNSAGNYAYPTYYSNAINGLSVMGTTDGVNGIMTSTFTPTSMSAVTILSVHAVRSNSGGRSVLFAAWPGGGNDYASGILIDEEGSGESSFATRDFMGQYPIAAANTTNFRTKSTAFNTYLIERDRLNSSNVSLAINGSAEGSQATTASGTMSTSNVGIGLRYCCGGSYASGNDFVGEMMIYSSTLSTANYQELEGYLACKWGLQSNLPAGHPYHAACPPGGFLPTSVASLVAWWDLSDAANTSVGYVTSQVNDKSGNSVTMSQATSADQPFYVTSGINSIGSLSFNGSDYMTGNLGSAPGNNAPHTIVAVGYGQTGLGTSQALYGYDSTPSSNLNSAIGIAPFNATSDAWWFGGFGQDSGYGGGANNGNPHIFTKKYDGTTITGNYDGSQVFSQAASYNLSSGSVILGAQDTSLDGRLSGKIGEVLVYNRALSTNEIQYLEGYLACKWGLQSRLPASHPYKASSCPFAATVPSLSLTLSVSPVGNQLPGTDLTYSTTYTNTAGFLYNPVFTDPIPNNTDFKVGSVTSNQGSTGLTAAFSYSNDNGVSFTYTPVSGGGGAAAGYDRNVTTIKCTLTGSLGFASSVNSGTIGFTSKIQ